MLRSRGLLALSVSIFALLVGCGGDDVTLSPVDAGPGGDATVDGSQGGDDAADGSAGTDATDERGGADGATSDAGGSDAPADAPPVTDGSTDAPAADAGTDAAGTDAGMDAAASDAATDAPPDGGLDSGLVCVQDLSNVHQGDFRISFTIQTTQTGEVAVANQRATCGPDNFWDVRLDANGSNSQVGIETDDVTGDGGTPNDAQLDGCAVVNDGASHHVVVQRVGGVIAIFVDGIFNGSTASTSNLVALPPLVTGNDVCVGVDGTAAFDTTKGSIGDLCLATAFTPLAVPDAGACK